MSLDSVINNVRNFMSANYMLVDQDWLSECVSYLFENNYNENEIKEQTKEQWLLNNLKDVCPGCLPPNLKSSSRTVLTGRYVLQINAAEDIGTPGYQQYLKLQKVNTENIEATMKFEENVPSRRMIKLYMTDGVQDVTGIEYRPMKNLSLDLMPGCKVLVKGPIECRRGNLLLTESCVELLGGEVEDLISMNSQAAILAAKLNLTLPQPSHTNIAVNVPIVNNIENVPTTNFNEDDLDIEDIDELDKIEAQCNDTLTKRSSDSNVVKPVKKFKPDPPAVPDEDMFPDNEDYLRDMEAEIDERENELLLDAMATSTEISWTNSAHAQKISKIQKMSPEPFVYIKQIEDLDETERKGMLFKVKAQILKILSKLTVGKDGWSLSCTIVDGTGSMDVEFSSDALSKLVGFTPQEMIQKKKQMATDPNVKESVVAALEKAKHFLQVLYCIIEIIIMDRPVITQLVPFESSHADSLRRRLLDSGL